MQVRVCNKKRFCRDIQNGQKADSDGPEADLPLIESAPVGDATKAKSISVGLG